MARKPDGDRALTAAERKAKHRQRHAAYVDSLKEALRRIEEEARTLREAREIAADARGGEKR